MVEIRKLLLLPLDDLLVVTRKFINPDVSRSGLDRCLRRFGVSDLRALQPKIEAVTGKHLFDRECVALGIEHRLSPPRHPQTNGMVERFNRRIAEVTQQTRFASAAELETTLERYVTLYNHHIPQRALNHQTPIQALQEWQKKKPDLFVKDVYNLTGLDTWVAATNHEHTNARRCVISVDKQ